MEGAANSSGSMTANSSSCRLNPLQASCARLKLGAAPHIKNEAVKRKMHGGSDMQNKLACSRKTGVTPVVQVGPYAHECSHIRIHVHLCYIRPHIHFSWPCPQSLCVYKPRTSKAHLSLMPRQKSLHRNPIIRFLSCRHLCLCPLP